MRLLREFCGASFGLPATKQMLEIGAAFMRTESELILKSRRIVPARLLEHGFKFKAPRALSAEGFVKTMRAKGTSICVKRLALLLLFSISAGSAVSAQTPQAAKPNLETTLIPGMTVWITDSAGREETMRIVGVSGDIVTTTAGQDVRRLRMADVLRVRVRHFDPVINGALIGAGAAVVSGLFLCSLTEPWENCRDDVGPMFRIGAIGAGVGIGIDALIRRRITIYEAAQGSTRLHAAPFVARHAAGLRVSLSF